MLLAYALFCKRVSDDAQGEPVLEGVFGEAVFRYSWVGEPTDTPPPHPLPLTLFVGLVNGKPGRHTVTLMVTSSADLTDTKTPGTNTFDWSVGEPFAQLEIASTMMCHPGHAVIEFTILVDGEGLGRTYLPIRGRAERVEPKR